MRIFLICSITILLGVSFGYSQTAQVKKQLVEQLVKDGEVERSCVREQGGYLKVLDFSLLNLNKDKQPEYMMYGNGCACMGARRCNTWIYQRSDSGYKKIFGGEMADIDITKKWYNGYLEITAAYPFGPDGMGFTTFRFDGNTYRPYKCSECVNIGTRREKCNTTKCN